MVFGYHDTFEHGNVTVFYFYDNNVPANAANAYLLGIGHHHIVYMAAGHHALLI